MIRAPSVLLAGVCVSAAVAFRAPPPPPPPQQQVGTCVVQLDSVGGIGRQVEVRTGVVHLYANGGVHLHCKGEATSMRADSVAWYDDQGRVDMIGHVRFSDTTVTLDADRGNYFVRDEHLEAYQHVKLVNKKTGSSLSGSNLVYRRPAVGIRDTAELLATDRPTVEYRSESDTAGAEPYVILGDRVHMKGDQAAWASGNVTIDRSDFHARGDSTELYLDQGKGSLVYHAKVLGKDSVFALSGRIIQYRLKDRQLNWAQANGQAEANSADWRLLADTIQFALADNRIQSGIAWGDSTRPKALSLNQTIIADSLTIDSPGQVLHEVRGIGAARATATTDTTTHHGPDWMAGDTVVATFDSTAAGKNYLASLEARSKALAFYYVTGPDSTAAPAISYSRGERIVARFTPDQLDRVDVSGGTADGVYLEPGAVKAVKDSAAKAAEKKGR